MNPMRKLLKSILKETFEERVSKVNKTHTLKFVYNLMVNSSLSISQTLIFASFQWWVQVEREIRENEESLCLSCLKVNEGWGYL